MDQILSAIDAIFSFCIQCSTKHTDLLILGKDLAIDLAYLLINAEVNPLPQDIENGAKQIERMWQYFQREPSDLNILYRSAQHYKLTAAILRNISGSTREALQHSKDFAIKYLNDMESENVGMKVDLWEAEKASLRRWIQCCDEIVEAQRDVHLWSTRTPWAPLS